jgi:histidinol-phosphate aminotransferase
MLRPEVLGFEQYSAGLSIDAIKERYHLHQVVKLASNENPLGVSPVVQKVIKHKADLAFRYPQSGNPRLVAALAARHGVSPQCVVPGNGSDEIIDLLVRMRCTPGKDNVVAFRPGFSMYGLQSRFCGAEFREVERGAELDFPWEALLGAVDENTGILFVTTPDNPTGFTPPADELLALRKRLPETCLLVIDEAYMDFARPQERYSLLPSWAPEGDALRNVVFLRTFSKLYGLAGLRLGYGIMPPWLADYMWRVRLPFSVNILAEEAGLAALEDDIFRQATLDVTHAGMDYLMRELKALGCAVNPSQANFLLFRLPGNAKADAHGAFVKLLEKGVIIRHLKSFGLPNCLRVSIGAEQENKLFIEALRGALDG